MAGNVSQTDLETISQGIFDGRTTIDKLPDQVKSQMMQYWQSQGVDTTNPNPQVTQEQIQQLQATRAAQQGSGNAFLNSPIFKPIEWIGSKMYQAYSSTVSPALSTGLMAAHDMIYGQPEWAKGQSELEELGNVWDYSHNISPGQAVWMLGLNNDELKARGLDWKDIATDTAAVKAGTFHDTPTKNDPYGMMTRSQEYFGSGAAKWVTGGTDLLVSWYADPTVLAGKGLGAVKAAGLTRPITPAIEKATAVAQKAASGTLTPEQANKLAFDSFTSKSPFQALTDHVWDVKQANPDAAAARINSLIPTVSKSANGPAVARLLAQASDKTEVANVLRVSMGDDAARQTLNLQNEELGYQINQVTAKQSSIGNYYDGLPDAQKMTPFGLRVKAMMDDQSAQLASLDQSKRIVSDKIDAFGTIGELNYNRAITPVTARIKSAYQSGSQWSFRPLEGDGRLTAAVNNIYSLGLGGIVRLAHAYGDIKPTHYIDVNDANAYKQLNASLMEVKGLSSDARDMYVSRFINADEQSKTLALQQIEQDVARNIVSRYNDRKKLTGTDDEISNEVADQLYKEIASRRSAAQATANEQSFSGAKIDDPTNPGLQLHVDQIEGDGGKVVTSPVLKSQMANNHVMMDFDLFQNAIKQNGSFWQKAVGTAGDAWHTTVGLGDYVNSVWKFGQLFRLGYAPRMLAADDAASQLARFGPWAMISRSIDGGKYTWQTARRAFAGDRLATAMVSRAHLENGISDLEEAQRELQSQIARAKNEGRTSDAANLESQLEGNMDDLNSHRQSLSDMDALVKGGQAMRHQKVGAQIFEPAFGGPQGSLFKDLTAGEKSFDNMFGAAADSYLNRLRRMDWTMLSPVKHGEGVHMDAWLRSINQQIANDELAVKYLKNPDQERLTNWLSSPEGLEYSRENALSKHLPNDQVVKRVAAHVDDVLNPAFPGSDALRQAAISGSVTKDMLKEVPIRVRPLINGQALSYARGNHSAFALLDKAMDNYFKYAAQIPGQFLLRNPLFAQRYGVHIQDLMKRMGKGDNDLITHDLQMQVQNAARLRALQDVKKNTFTMDYETKISHSLRQLGSFFGAQQESWNRWARIISDKPDILPRIAQVYNAPTRAGLEVDGNGMPIDAEGYSRDPVTGERKLTSFGERSIQIQIPDYLGGKAFKKFFGLDPNAVATIPMNTFVMVMSHGDGPNPVGAGPIVQVAANQMPFTGLDANGNPDLADLYKRLGILPFGPQKMDVGTALETMLPTWARKSLADQGDMSETYNQHMWNIMQAENYKYRAGMRTDAPTWNEISDRAHTQTWLKVLSGFSLPFSVNTQDPYQFFRDQYRQMVSRDPKNADQQFYDKFGDSAYIFAKSLSKNNTGLQPTTNGIKMSKYYQDLIDKVGPQWAGLIVGDDGSGVYSQGAYYYMKTHSITPGAGPAISQMTPREALAAANTDRGFKQYTSYMNGLYAQLFQRGLQTFSDSGAEDLKAQKDALITVLTSPRLPASVLQNLQSQIGGGQAATATESPMIDNPFYNADWTKSFNTQDKTKYTETAASLRQVVNDPEIWSKAVNPDGTVGIRSDIYYLKTYLSYRDDFQKALIMRKENGGSDSPTAKSNEDLKYQWDSLVTTLLQQSTTFGDLFNRHLSKDMGYNETTAAQEQQSGQLGQFTGSLEAPSDMNQPDATSVFGQY